MERNFFIAPHAIRIFTELRKISITSVLNWFLTSLSTWNFSIETPRAHKNHQMQFYVSDINRKRIFLATLSNFIHDPATDTSLSQERKNRKGKRRQQTWIQKHIWSSNDCSRLVSIGNGCFNVELYVTNLTCLTLKLI